LLFSVGHRGEVLLRNIDGFQLTEGRFMGDDTALCNAQVKELKEQTVNEDLRAIRRPLQLSVHVEET
jgi:hypothetical protein